MKKILSFFCSYVACWFIHLNRQVTVVIPSNLKNSWVDFLYFFYQLKKVLFAKYFVERLENFIYVKTDVGDLVINLNEEIQLDFGTSSWRHSDCDEIFEKTFHKHATFLEKRKIIALVDFINQKVSDYNQVCDESNDLDHHMTKHEPSFGVYI